MNKFDRILGLLNVLKARRHPVSIEVIAADLECSVPTAKRLIRKLRDELDAPVTYDRERGGYLLDRTDDRCELPGLWFNASELYALLVMRRLLERIEPGLFKENLAALQGKIEKLLASHPCPAPLAAHRIHLLSLGDRPRCPSIFRQAAEGVLRRRQLQIAYRSRATDAESRRLISPQRLVHYRDNWYLDAWCHKREGFRTFALDRLRGIEILAQPARECSDTEMDDHFAAGYGIFAGPATHEAVLRFTPRRARWVAEERWHPEQQARHLPDGSFELRFPYAAHPELLQDILKYGPEVEVLAPASLRRLVADHLRRALARYAGIS
jgi:proteasome accessory factor C